MRGNGNGNDQRAEGMGHSRHEPRQNDSKYNSGKKNEYLMTDSGNYPMFRSPNENNGKDCLSRNSSQANPYFLNLKFIKTPKNGEQKQ